MNAESLRAKGWLWLNGQWYAPNHPVAKKAKRFAEPPEGFGMDAISLALKPKTARRLRQDSKPLLNQLETEWFEVLKDRYSGGYEIHAQAWRVKLAAGAWFKVDFCVFAQVFGGDRQWIAYEVKGPKKGKNVARGILALKCAAHQFPEICFVLVWKDDDGQWQEQIVKP